MTKLLTVIGGILRTLVDKVHTPIASPSSLAVPTGRRDVKPVETESSTAAVEYLNSIP